MPALSGPPAAFMGALFATGYMFPLIKGNPKLSLTVHDKTGYMGFMRLNHLTAPFNNPAIRQAVFWAIDQDDFMQAVVGTDPALPTYLDPALAVPLNHDSTAARRQDAVGSMLWRALAPGAEPRTQILLPPLKWSPQPDDAQALHLSSIVAGRDSAIKSFQVQLGASFSRSESVSDLIGEGSRSDMLSVSMPIGDQIVDQRTLQNHKAPRASSDLLYKNALYGQSRSIFSGLIIVDEGAHYTDAYQTCRNLLNSNEAEATSLPGLEINADQVKCSHGATSGPIAVTRGPGGASGPPK